MKKISKYVWACWIGIVPSLVGITFKDWKWWAFIVITISLVELGYRVREQENE